MPRNKFALAGCVIAGLIFVFAGLSRISFNIDILKLLPTHLPQVEGLSLFLKKFSLSNELIITIAAPDSDTAESTANQLAEHLRSRPDLVRRAVSEPPWEKNPAQLSELLAMLLLNQPPEKIRALTASLSADQAPSTVGETLDKLNDSFSAQEVAMLSYDPYGLTSAIGAAGFFSQAAKSEFASPDGTFRVIYVEAAPALGNYKQAIAWIDEIKKIARGTVPRSEVQLGFTGEPAFVADISSTMEWDMASSGFITLLVIAAIFWGCYRRTRPLFDLQLMLVLIFTISLAAAGLFLRELTVIGVGFSSIMIGLSVDYGYFIYQKSLRHTGTLRELQIACLQNIMWTAGTTSAAFFSLNFSSLPGISQLGNLVGIGVIVGGAIMLLVFAPMAMRWKKLTPRETKLERWMASPSFISKASWAVGGLVIALTLVLVWKGLPKVDGSSKSLRPKHSEAYEALDQLTRRLTNEDNLLSLVVKGQSEADVLQRLLTAEKNLVGAQARGDVKSFQSPLPLWPNAINQSANLARLQPYVSELSRLRQTALEKGFTDESFVLTQAIFEQINTWSTQRPPLWPENEASRWIYRRLASRETGGNGEFVAVGFVATVSGREDAVAAAVQGNQTWLVSWSQLGAELKRVIPNELGRLVAGLLGIVLVLLVFAFGGFRDVAVLLVTLALVFVSLLGAMSLLGMQWNFFNLTAILLLLGTGIDYAILLLLALKRNGGSVAEAHKSLGIVIFLCATSAAAGFGTLGWANNQGLASLGQTCALGLVLDALISVFLLPKLWRISRFVEKRKDNY